MPMQTGNAEAMSDAFAKFIHDVSKKVRLCLMLSGARAALASSVA
jgi:hypothetical protein